MIGVVCVILAVIVCAGCSSGKNQNIVVKGNGGRIAIAACKVSGKQIRLDGILNESVWKGRKYLLTSAKRSKIGLTEEEKGEEGFVSVLCDNENLYIGGRFRDRDIISRSTKDAQKHYKKGDVCEVFLKPMSRNWYWEIWVTPKGYKIGVLWILFKDGTKEMHRYYKLGMEAMGYVEGTINKSSDVDKYWSFELKIPIEKLRFPVDILADGDKKVSINDWTMLVARQDFTEKVDLKHRKLSSYPQLSQANFHRYSEYAKLRCVKCAKK